jgi:hypothetical protein
MMKNKDSWDWETDSKEVPIGEWREKYNWIEDIHVSPDGEKVASIVNIDDAEFGICENGSISEGVFEKAWSLKYAPNGDSVCFVANDDEWTVFTCGDVWEETFDYIWDMKISYDGSHIGASVQRDGKYGMVVNDSAWENMHENIAGTIMGDKGNTAGVVQVDSLNQADIEGFNTGIFAVALDGNLISDKHMNIWDLSINCKGTEVAYSIRKNRTDYSIGRNKSEWSSLFQCSWKPEFTVNNSVIAPVKQGDWSLYKDDKKLWNNNFLQITKLATFDDNISAVVSDKYGMWAISENDNMWDLRCDKIITDLYYSDDGKSLVSVFKDKDHWDVAINNSRWNLKADKLWRPVVSNNNEFAATRIEMDGKYYLVVNGTLYKTGFDMIFEPEISPDSSKILLKVLDGDTYNRFVLSLDQIL